MVPLVALVVALLLVVVAPATAIDIWLSSPTNGNLGSRAGANALCSRSGFQTFALVAFSGDRPITDCYFPGTNTRFDNAPVNVNGRQIAGSFTSLMTGYTVGSAFGTLGQTGGQYWCNWGPNAQNSAAISYTGGGQNCNDWTSASSDLGGKGGWYGMPYLCGPPSYPPYSAVNLFTGPSCASSTPLVCVGVPAGQVLGANYTGSTITSDAYNHDAALVAFTIMGAYVLW